MDVLLVVDMQVGLLKGPPKHDLAGVVQRINALAGAIRRRSGKVVWIQHCGARGDDFEPKTPGWLFLPELVRFEEDLVAEKTLNDPFAGTDLKAQLDDLAPKRLVVMGWATDFCVDATVRSAVSNSFDIITVSDGHTLSDRPQLAAPDVTRHHNWVWSGLITKRTLRSTTASELLRELQ